MDSQVAKWGNSFALRIPAAMARTLNVHEGSRVEMTVEGDALVIRPQVSRAKMELADLVSRINQDNLHAEFNTGAPVGNES